MCNSSKSVEGQDITILERPKVLKEFMASYPTDQTFLGGKREPRSKQENTKIHGEEGIKHIVTPLL